MMTTLFSVSFTSCIDNEVSPLVEAIYEGQADLLAAQAAVQTAEAAYLTARANAEDAQADLTIAQAAQVDAYTAGLLENNAYNALVHEQQLMSLAASTATAVAQAEMALEIAQANFNIEMAELAADLEAAGAQLATEYAYAYRYAMEAANYILMDKLEAEADLAEAQLMFTDYGSDTLSWAYVLAMLEGDIATEMANKVALEDAIAVLEATMADPTSIEAIRSQLDAEEDAIDALIDAKNIEMAEKFNEIMAIYEENGIADEFIDRFEEANDDLEDIISEKEDQEDIIEAAQEAIVELEAILADYPAALAAAVTADADATLAEEAAQTVVDDAVAALGEEVLPAAMAGDDAIDPVVTYYEELWNAQLVLADAQAAWTLLDTDVAALYVTYQDAIDALALLDAGLPALEAALAAAEAAMVPLVATQVTEQGQYDAALAIYVADPSGVTWNSDDVSDPTTADDVIGDHTDDDDPNTTETYYEVLTAAPDPVTFAATAYPSAAGGADLTVAQFALVNNDYSTLAVGEFYNVEANDASDTNADLLNIEVADLDAANDAVAAQQLLIDAANEAITDYDVLLAEANETFLYQQSLYEEGAALLAAAQDVVDAADADVVAAQTVVDDAVAALGMEVLPAAEAGDDAIEDAETSYELLWNAQLAALDAAEALADLEACDEACIQADIDAENDTIEEATAKIAAIQPVLDAKQAVVDAMQAEYDEYIANEGFLSSLQADLHAAIIAEWQAYWVLEQELAALEFQEELKISMINAYGGWGADNLDDLAGYIEDLQEDILEANTDIEAAEVALALAQTEEAADTAYLEYLQALIDTLSARHANAVAIANEYKALLDAALAS